MICRIPGIITQKFQKAPEAISEEKSTAKTKKADKGKRITVKKEKRVITEAIRLKIISG